MTNESSNLISKAQKFVVYYCVECEETTNFAIDYVHKVPVAGPPEEYTLGHYIQCNYPALFIREDMGDGFENDCYYRLYPSHERHIGFWLPPIVRTSYEEAVRCETAKAWIASVVMVGRTLEAVCKEFEPDTKGIFDGLKAMHKNGLISQELLDWANELRKRRNLGAHATSKKIEKIDAKEPLDFLQAILEIMYYLRPKFEEMKQRTAK